MKGAWLDRFLDSIADRGRDLLGRRGETARAADLEGLCDALLSSRGEASGTALAREVVQAYEGLDSEQRLAFFKDLAEHYGPSKEAVLGAAERYREADDLASFLALAQATEPPRQELFRRINMAPQGTAALVRMRTHLLDRLHAHPDLKAVDADLQHLLASWFNRGFLRLERIDWQTSAAVLEKLIAYESVHAIQGWEDLRRRLERDRRCFAFMHPALPGEPLIFVEVALTRGISTAVQPLIDPQSPVHDPESADTAIFYSINNTQQGLRGISFGNFLIKQVVSELAAELPKLQTFATLSPLPGFVRTLRHGTDAGAEPERAAGLDAILALHREDLVRGGLPDADAASLLRQLSVPGKVPPRPLGPVLQSLALAYLSLCRTARGEPVDPVARFHLANGARLERINPFADVSEGGLERAFGVMVNYRYDPDSVVPNHERFVAHGEITMSRAVAKEHKRLEAAWRSAAGDAAAPA